MTKKKPLKSSGSKKATKKLSEVIKGELTPKQERFCQLYAGTEEFFCHGVHAYAEAFDRNFQEKGVYNTCCVEANRLLRNPKILKRLDEIFEARGLNDQFVDKQLEKLITQDADFKSKIQAIKEYNSMKKRTGKLEIPPDMEVAQIVITRAKPA